MRGWTEWIQNLCYLVMTHNDLFTCIALTKWDGPVVCVNVTEMLTTFKVNVIILPQPKPQWQYQWSNMNMTELAVARFLLISKKYRRYHNHCPARVRFVYNRGRSVVTEERLKRLVYLNPWMFEYEFRYMYATIYGRQAIIEWRIKVPKANSKWYVEYVQLV